MDAAAADPHYLPLHQVASVGLGNALEFYDFFAFSYFAIQIGHTFFPASLTKHGLLFSLASFALGSITRPLGGIIIGRYGDRVGRQPAMLWSFGLMGLGLLGLALTPSYAQIGAVAPALLLVFRLIQGIGVGGEVGPTTAFLIEAAPPNRRGLYGSLQFASQYVAVILSGVVGFLLSACLSPAQLDSWGWRVAFLLGTLVVPIGLYIRRTLPETLPASAITDSAAASARLSPRLIVPALAMLTAMTMSGYTVSYMITYVQDTLHLSANSAFGAPFVEGLSYIVVAAVSGSLSDRFGRRPLMRIGVGLLLIATLPCYLALVTWPSASVVYTVTALLSGLGALWCNPALVGLVESLPTRARAGAFGLLYSVATTVFGGCTQFLLKWLIDVTRSPLAPAGYLIGALTIAACAMLWVRESAPCRLQSERGSPE